MLFFFVHLVLYFLRYLTLILFIPQNRVIIKVDSGPGCTNIKMLAYICALGVYCVPGVLNTTHVSQETDQSYGLFKSIFRSNLEVLSQARFDQKKIMQIQDILLLVFGSTTDDEHTKIVADNCFDKLFSIKVNIDCWKKCGALPLT